MDNSSLDYDRDEINKVEVWDDMAGTSYNATDDSLHSPVSYSYIVIIIC